MWLGTFHAMGVRMLRAHAELVGLQSSFTILDSDDQERLAKQVIQAADLDERRWPARLLVAIIQRWKDRGYRRIRCRRRRPATSRWARASRSTRPTSSGW